MECKYTSHGARLIEVNCRMGGGPVRNINLLVWGVDLVEEHLLTTAGIPSRPPVAPKPLMNIAEFSSNAKQTGVVRDTDFCKARPLCPPDRSRPVGCGAPGEQPRGWLVSFFAPFAWRSRSGCERTRRLTIGLLAALGEAPRRVVLPAAGPGGREGHRCGRRNADLVRVDDLSPFAAAKSCRRWLSRGPVCVALRKSSSTRGVAWTCRVAEMMVTKPSVEEAINFVKGIEESLDIQIGSVGT